MGAVTEREEASLASVTTVVSAQPCSTSGHCYRVHWDDLKDSATLQVIILLVPVSFTKSMQIFIQLGFTFH